MNVSIIIPTYNRADVVISSLITWAKQSISEEEFEVIVVDNNSTDGSPELIKSFVSKYPNFTYLKETKVGSTFARHAGAKIAKSEILLFCDDDGLFNSSCIESVLKVYKANPEVSAVAGRIDLKWDKTPPEWIKPYEFMLGKLDYGEKVIIGNELYLNGGLFSIRRNVFEMLKGFNPDLIGEYLVGDGDTGLVRKLHANNFLIGWTPYACMQHMLSVDKHGTINDLGRRFYNIGISETYARFRATDFKIEYSLIRQLMFDCTFFTKKSVEYMLSGMKSRKVYFSLMQLKGKLAFYRKWGSPTFRASCKQIIKLDHQ